MSDGMCLSGHRLRSYLDGELGREEHGLVAAHVLACAACAEAARGAEPTRLFSRLSARATPAGLWEDLWPAVERELRARPRPAPRPAFLSWRHPRLAWLAPVAVAAAVALISWLGLRPAGVEKASRPADTVAEGFVYLTNPDAQVTHILMPDEEHGAVQLTMVVDKGLEGAF